MEKNITNLKPQHDTKSAKVSDTSNKTTYFLSLNTIQD